MDLELWHIISRDIQERRELLLSNMELGQYQQIEKYREAVGFLAGLRFIEDSVRTLNDRKLKHEEFND